MTPSSDPSRGPGWSRALTIATILHGLAIGALFVRFVPAADTSAEMPAIAIEMANPVAPPAPVHDTPTPRQIEAPKQTPQKQPNPRTLPFDPPPPQAAEAKPEVVLPPKKEETSKAAPVNPLPPAPTTTEQAAPDLKPDAKTAALLTNGASAGKASPADLWATRVLSRIELMKRYPSLALRENQQDEVTVLLTMDRDGRLLGSEIGSGRGFAALNEASLDAVRRAAPFPKPPKEIVGDPIRLTVIIQFLKKVR